MDMAKKILEINTAKMVLSHVNPYIPPDTSAPDIGVCDIRRAVDICELPRKHPLDSSQWGAGHGNSTLKTAALLGNLDVGIELVTNLVPEIVEVRFRYAQEFCQVILGLNP